MHTPLYRKSLFVGAVALCLLVATPVYAAKFTIELPSISVAPGSEVMASVYFDTQNESINAVGGTFSVPAFLKIASVRDGSSIVPVWVEAPKASSDDSEVVFAGITPGGYRGERGLLFSVVLRAGESEGSGTLLLSDLQALKNDGKGTDAKVTSAPAKLVVSSKSALATSTEKADITPPESFAIQLVQTPDAFGGQKALIFATQDKGSGVARYEVCEGFFASCTTGESAYVLKGQRADTRITVVAYDASGNARAEHLYTPAAIMRYALYAIFVILLGVGAWFLSRRKK